MRIAYRASTFVNGNRPTTIFIIRSHSMERRWWRAW